MRILKKGNVNVDTATCLNRTLMACHGIKSTTSKSSPSIRVTQILSSDLILSEKTKRTSIQFF
jgi:hypothetical protein